nr:DUF2029 domain-containing protein [Deltaproteobacteria bacterium]
VYERKLYADPDRFIGGLKVDVYHYPPPFLLLPAALQAVGGDYLGVRPLWFAIQVLVLLAMLFTIARWLGGREGHAVAVVAPLFFVAPVTLFTLQMGNFQATAFALSLLAMIALHAERARVQVAGGFALAFATLGKVFPGVLGIVLLATRRWRAVLWTVGAAAVLIAISIAVFGTRPFTDFIGYELPRLANGEAFPQSERAQALAANQSFYGLLVKLRALGLDALDQRVGLQMTSIYGLCVLAVACAVSWRCRRLLLTDRVIALFTWLALLNLASFRSPFVGGGYGMMGTVLLVTLGLAATKTRSGRIAWACLYVAFALINLIVPTPKATPPLTEIVVLSLFGQLLALAANATVLIATWRAASRPVTHSTTV